MKQIYYSENRNIAFDLEHIEINGKKVQQDMLGDHCTVKYAYKKMREIYSSILPRQYENIIVLSGAGPSKVDPIVKTLF